MVIFLIFSSKRSWWHVRMTGWSHWISPVPPAADWFLIKPTICIMGRFACLHLIHICDIFIKCLAEAPLPFISWQDQLFVPFPSLMALQPAIPGASSAPDTLPETAALHRPGALPHWTALPAARHWEGPRELAQKGESLSQVNHEPLSRPFYVMINTGNNILINLCCLKGTWRGWQMWMQQTQATPT